MTLAITASEPVAFTPAHYGEQENAPVYYLKVPKRSEKMRFREQLYKSGLNIVDEKMLFAVLRQGVKACIDEEDQAQWLDAIDAYEEAGLACDQETRVLYSTIEMEIASTYTPYQVHRAQYQIFNDQYASLLVRWFLDSVEGLDVKLERKRKLITDGSLDALPEMDLQPVASEIVKLMTLTKEQEKNLPSPSPSQDTQTTSIAE